MTTDIAETKPYHLDFMRQTGAVYCPNPDNGYPTVSFVAPTQGSSLKVGAQDTGAFCAVWLSQKFARELLGGQLTQDDRLLDHSPHHRRHLMRIQSPVGDRAHLAQVYYGKGEGFYIGNGKHRFQTFLTANAPWIPIEMPVADAVHLPTDRAGDYVVDQPMAPLFRGPLAVVFDNHEHLRDPCEAHRRSNAPMTYGAIYETMVLAHKLLPFEIRNRAAFSQIDHEHQAFSGIMYEQAKGLYEFLGMILPTVKKIQEQNPDLPFAMEGYPKQIPQATPRWTLFGVAKGLLTRREVTIDDMPVHTAAGAAAQWLKTARQTFGDDILARLPALKPLVVPSLTVPTP